MTRTMLFACMMCFAVGGCLGVFVTVAASRPKRNVLWGWVLYLAVVLAFVYKIGGALIL